ncbi:hypothetical protein KTF47_09830, partial [Bifidobacterium longum]|uniref:hypothetical protein n=1 Tax=Bifidobacterium longum TaxID=216816 RepID=UPI001C21627C
PPVLDLIKYEIMRMASQIGPLLQQMLTTGVIQYRSQCPTVACMPDGCGNWIPNRAYTYWLTSSHA